MNRIKSDAIRRILLLLNYVIGYMYVYPKIISWLTLLKNPTATYVSEPLQYSCYIWMIVSSILIAFPLIKSEVNVFLQNKRHFLKKVIQYFLFYEAISLFISLFYFLIIHLPESVNQQEIQTLYTIFPKVTLFSTLMYAPIVEELVFRTGLFSLLRKKMRFLPAAFIGGFSFGFVHVLNSFLSGNSMDLLYLFLYGCSGMFFCYIYEKEKCIYLVMFVHFLNNLISCIGMIL